jgi:hypothetical protein
MRTTIQTILALSTVACSTSFDEQEQALNQKNPSVESADFDISLHGPFQDDEGFVPVELNEDVDSLETDEPTNENINLPGGEDLAAAREISEMGTIEAESFDFNSMLAKTDHGTLSLRMWPGRDLQTLICFQYDGNQESCVEDTPTYFGSRYGGEVSAEFHAEDVISYTMKVMTAAGSRTEYGPFEMPERENHWQEELSCDSTVKVENIKYRITDDEEQSIIVKFFAHSAVSAVICGANDDGVNICDWSPEGSSHVEVSLPYSQELSPRDFLVVDHQGCSRAYNLDSSP